MRGPHRLGFAETAEFEVEHAPGLQASEPREGAATAEEITGESPTSRSGTEERGEQRKRRRRRGRRGRKERTEPVEEGKETPAAPHEKEEEAADEPSAAGQEAAAEESESSERKRRRRRRKKSEAAAEEEGAVEEVTETQKIKDEEEDVPIEDMSAWSVPSWAEIIASLYRPER
jgi:ribonuclease E